jgi:Winged helix DNA-binding domain
VTTLADIGPLRLAAQRLVGEREPTAGDAVRRLLAVQAQDLPGALTSVALRTAARDRAEVVAALDSGEVVRSWPMRGTLHLVPADDLPWMLGVLGFRTLSGVAKRWANLGLDEAQCEQAREAVLTALDQQDRWSRTELLQVIAEGGVATSGQRGYHLLWYLSQTGTLCLGPTGDGGDQLFVRSDRWIREPRRLASDEAHAELALRFFTGHGPATVQDLVRWSGSTARAVRAGLAEVRDRLDAVTVDGTEYLMDSATPERLAAARDEADGVLLLPGFDEFVLGYGDRTAVLPAAHVEKIVPGGNGMFRPTVVHRGQVVGTWRWTGRGAKRTVEAEPFTTFPRRVAAAIPELAAALATP